MNILCKFIASIALLFISIIASAQPVALSDYYMLDGSPADHNAIVAGREWKTNITWGTGTYQPCSSSSSDSTYLCYFDISPNVVGVPPSAIAVKLRIKTKAWSFPTVGITPHCQVTVKVPSDTHTKNFMQHTEIAGNSTEQRRRVSYTNAIVLLNDQQLRLQVGRDGFGNCWTSIAVYVEGYYL